MALSKYDVVLTPFTNACIGRRDLLGIKSMCGGGEDWSGEGGCWGSR